MFACSVCKYEDMMDVFPVSQDCVCSTVAYAPAENPQYAVIIIVDEPQDGVLYGSVVAAPYVADVMENILPYLGVEAVYSESELKKFAVETPNCIGMTGSYALRHYGSDSQTGLEVIVIGDEDGVVRRQYPEKGTVMERSSGKLILYTGARASEIEPEMTTVPDLIGKGAVAANQELIEKGLNIRIEGTKNYMTGAAKVVSQSIEPGSVVPKGTVITVRFLHEEDDYTGQVIVSKEELLQ
jgi:stage V sporulation protein D (sporulation-specific penicillin-binding protein)